MWPRAGCFNIYDIRPSNTCGDNWPSGIGDLRAYLQQVSVQRALNIDEPLKHWQECNPLVYDSLTFDDAPSVVVRSSSSLLGLSSTDMIPSVLGTHIGSYSSVFVQVLCRSVVRQVCSLTLSSGEYDMICNHKGTEKLISRLDWPGWTEFHQTNGSLVCVQTTDGYQAGGHYRYAHNLHYMLVFNAGHMTPLDAPEASYEIVSRLLGSSSDSFDAGSSSSRHCPKVVRNTQRREFSSKVVSRTRKFTSYYTEEEPASDYAS